MKKLASILFSLSIILSAIYLSPSYAFAYDDASPVISLELGNYNDEDERGFFSADTVRLGRGKASASAGERVVLTFILSGVESLDYFQLSGSYDERYLSPGYYTGTDMLAVWQYGDDEQDFNTVVDGCGSFGLNGFDSSFSFTRAEQQPNIYLCAYSLDGAAALQEHTTISGYTVSGTPLISVGFDVISDIDNIYNVFSWQADGTMISTGNTEYYLGSGLGIACKHNFQLASVLPTCSSYGYDSYTCIYCADECRQNYVGPLPHSYVAQGRSGDTFSYSCKYCSVTAQKAKQELKAYWNVEYVNNPPTASNASQYLDVVSDGIINAKDFAQISK